MMNLKNGGDGYLENKEKDGKNKLATESCGIVGRDFSAWMLL